MYCVGMNNTHQVAAQAFIPDISSSRFPLVQLASVIDRNGRPVGFIAEGLQRSTGKSYSIPLYSGFVGERPTPPAFIGRPETLGESVIMARAANIYANAVTAAVAAHGVTPAYTQVADLLNRLTRKYCGGDVGRCFGSLVDYAGTSGRTYRPSLSALTGIRGVKGSKRELTILADAYDAAQAALGDPRRAYRN